MLPKLPRKVETVLQTIADNGGQGYIVGGALRDLLLGKSPHDWDFATTLPESRLLEIFPNARAAGGPTGAINLPFGYGKCEVAPCRPAQEDFAFKDAAGIAYPANIFTDLSRRDFTVNAMAYDGSILIDPFGGQQDLRNGLLRCVGDPARCFAEDPLRILRLFRLAATLYFAPEFATYGAAVGVMRTLSLVSAPRVREEIERILISGAPQVLGIIIAKGGLHNYGLHFAPELGLLSELPRNRLCRWWALTAVCGANVAEVGRAFGFSRRFLREIDECTRLYRLGPSYDKIELKLKLRYALLDYSDISATFATVSPAFLGEPVLFAAVRAKREPYRLAELAVNGEMLGKEGLHGEKCGQVLDELLKMVIKNPVLNQRPVLIGLAKELKNIL